MNSTCERKTVEGLNIVEIIETEKEESIIQRLTGNNSQSSAKPEDTSLKGIWKNNLLVQRIGESPNNLENFHYDDIQREFEKTFLNTQIKPKWHQNP